MTSIYNLDLETLQQKLEAHGCSFPETTVTRIFHYLYRERKIAPLPDNRISQKSMTFLANGFSFSRPNVVSIHESSDQTVKFLMEFSDGEKAETVLIPFPGRYAVCLSTQVGCAMKCSFCFTGTQGLKRNLTSGEIITQYLLAWEWLEKNRPDQAAQPKIVFMGQGEPLHNFDEVKKAIGVMVSQKGMQIGARRITVSTSGYLPGLKRFHELPTINLALSFHSPFDLIRSKLIPLNKSYPLEKVLAAIDNIPFKKNQAINYEYLLIDNINNSDEDVFELSKILFGKRGIVNLIPFNEYPGSKYKRPEPTQVIDFQSKLLKCGIHTTVRTTKGDDILAACGQLKS